MRSIFTYSARKQWKLSPTKTIALVFLFIILLGAGLLTLPIASRSGVSCGFSPALFTATSATCVTGLVMYDTFTQWSAFGQVVILSMIELGGLGFMTAASLVMFLLRKRVGLQERMIMAQALSLNEMEGVVRLQRIVLIGSLSIQAAGALVLFLRFFPEYGVRTAAWWGVFHAVSAFCIAPGASAAAVQNDPVVLITLMILIILGGLGFFVWEEVVRVKDLRKCSVYTRMVLLATLVLTVGGAALFCLLEWNNPATFGSMSAGDKILNGFFQSVTLRTAGFAGVDQAGLTQAGKGASLVLMLIGGSSGSTAGGAKTVTMMVLMLFLAARLRGRETVRVFHRTVPQDKVLDAMTIVSILVGLAIFGAVFVSATSPVSFTDSLFECVSALATVGVTAGATGSLSIPAQFLIILYMYFGRVGVLTLSLGFLMGNKAEQRYQYAQTNLLIG